MSIFRARKTWIYFGRLDLEELFMPMDLISCNTYDRVRRGRGHIRKLVERPGIRFHDLRRTHGSRLAQNPAIPLTTIRDLLGHSNLSVTNRYASLQGNHFAAVSGALGGTKSGTNIRVTHQICGIARDLKSLVSTNFTT